MQNLKISNTVKYKDTKLKWQDSKSNLLYRFQRFGYKIT